MQPMDTYQIVSHLLGLSKLICVSIMNLELKKQNISGEMHLICGEKIYVFLTGSKITLALLLFRLTMSKHPSDQTRTGFFPDITEVD